MMILINIPLTLVAFTALVILSVIANFWRIHAREAYLRVPIPTPRYTPSYPRLSTASASPRLSRASGTIATASPAKSTWPAAVQPNAPR